MKYAIEVRDEVTRELLGYFEADPVRVWNRAVVLTPDPWHAWLCQDEWRATEEAASYDTRGWVAVVVSVADEDDWRDKASARSIADNSDWTGFSMPPAVSAAARSIYWCEGGETVEGYIWLATTRLEGLLRDGRFFMAMALARLLARTTAPGKQHIPMHAGMDPRQWVKVVGFGGITRMLERCRPGEPGLGERLQRACEQAEEACDFWGTTEQG